MSWGSYMTSLAQSMWSFKCIHVNHVWDCGYIKLNLCILQATKQSGFQHHQGKLLYKKNH